MYNVVIGSKYTIDGQEKTRWTKVGEAFQNARGYSLRLDVPVLTKPAESTWFNLFEKEQNNGVSKKDDKTSE